MAIKFSDLPFLPENQLSLGSIVPVVQNGENFKIALSSINKTDDVDHCNDTVTLLKSISACPGSDTISISANLNLNGYSLSGVSNNSIYFKSGAKITSSPNGDITFVPLSGESLSLGTGVSSREGYTPGIWTSTASTFSASSGNWEGTKDYIDATAPTWDSAAAKVQAGADTWDITADIVKTLGDVTAATDFESQIGTVQVLSALKLGDNWRMDMVAVGSPGNADDADQWPGRSGVDACTNEDWITGNVDYFYQIGKYEINYQMIVDYNNCMFDDVLTKDRTPESLSAIPCGYYEWISVSWPVASEDLQKPARINTYYWCMLANFWNELQGFPPAYVFDEDFNPSGYNSATSNVIREWTPSDKGWTPGSEYRNAQAQIFLPIEAEWYKAAYFDPTAGCFNGGYWHYAIPGFTYEEPPEEVSGDTTLSGAVVTGQVAQVSAAGGLSYWGTMGQDGNAPEQMFINNDCDLVIERSATEEFGTGDAGKDKFIPNNQLRVSDKGARFVYLRNEFDYAARANAFAQLSANIKASVGQVSAVYDMLSALETAASFAQHLSNCASAFDTVNALSSCWTNACSALATSQYTLTSEISAIITDHAGLTSVDYTSQYNWYPAITSWDAAGSCFQAITDSKYTDVQTLTTWGQNGERPNIIEAIAPVISGWDSAVTTRSNPKDHPWEVTKILQMTQAEYEGLSSRDVDDPWYGPKSNILYIING